MTKYIERITGSAVVIMALALGSCASNDEDLLLPDGATPLVMNVNIASGSKATRAKTHNENDHWTYRAFEDGDEMGFFSASGNYEVDNGRGPISNAQLICEDSRSTDGLFRFRATDVQISQQYIKAENVYFYFPYSQAISTTGMELRSSAVGIDGLTTLRCVDYLEGNGVDPGQLEKGALSGEFEHTFSELIIMRGEGFDRPKAGKEDIYVVLKKPYTHIKATPQSDPWKIKLELTNQPGSQTARNDARYWQAWKGEIYAPTGSSEGKEAWYVVLPTLPGAPVEIDYIEIYDNDGKLQTVTSMSLMNGGRQLESGWRYPVEILMKELVPTVFPYRVVPWNPNKDLTDARTRGISDMSEFKDWLTAYTSYVNHNADQEDILFRYGDKVVNQQGETLYWHFYLLNDLNFSGEFAQGSAIIPKLQDVLDGKGSSFADNGFDLVNNRISNMPGPLVGTMQGNGSLRNINIASTSIISTKTEPNGILVNTMLGGTIDNCFVINGTLITNGPVGMAVGQANGGKITNCNLSGLLSGTSSHAADRYITGNNPVSVEITGNVSTVVFNQK